MRSSTKRAKLREPFTFFIDHNLGGRKLASELRRVGELVEVLSDHFPQDIKDVGWLPVVGEKGWAVLTADAMIARRPEELAALMRAGVAAFFVSKALQGNPAEVVSALPLVKKTLRRYRPPILAQIKPCGVVTVIAAEGERLEKPKTYRPPKGKGKGK